MLFNSFSFAIFLPIVFLLYWFVFNKSLKYQNLFLLLASYVFYGWWSVGFLLLLILSTLLDYLYGFGVASDNRKKAKLFLWLSIINNLGILGVFKYYNFFAEQFQMGFKLIGITTHPTFLQIVLPVGISFYTFHGMSYVFDIYRGLRKPVTSPVNYGLFVSFFPLLVAGPIERANHLLPQVETKRIFNYSQAVEGARLILWGLFKKIAIADALSGIADSVFKNYADHNALSLMLGAVAFSFQIYCDFSGYTDIALGTAKLFGFELLSNFKFPYFSRNIAEFWKRWHISLSSWFRDYLYIPLGGSKKGLARTILNTFIIFLVSGFWHGAHWNYIVWGFIHACGFLVLLAVNGNRRYSSEVVAHDRILPSFKELIQIISTFALVTAAWIFFRMDSVRNAMDYCLRIITGIIRDPGQFAQRPKEITIFIYIIPLLVIDWYLRRDERKLRVPAKGRMVIYVMLALMIFFSFGKKTNFIYFQF